MNAANDNNQAWSRVEFESQLRFKGAGYDIPHPFNVKMNNGLFSCEQNGDGSSTASIIRSTSREGMAPSSPITLTARRVANVCNAYSAMTAGRPIPVALMPEPGSVSPPAFPPTNYDALLHVAPGVRFAVDAYVYFARTARWQEAVCSSLTEMFCPKIHKDRLANWPQHYAWIEADGLRYFRSRISLAERDVEHCLQVTLDHFIALVQQQRALEIPQFKLDMLGAMLDAVKNAYP